ncbi:MAG: cupin domain-containing protein [Alphaproteobacteria bacterium]|nr:MAG: cupin domain-containing protein [Alphaproteobacteria bacterium]
MLGAAAAGGVAAAATGTETFGQGQPPFGPTPAPLAGTELPSFRFQLGAVAPKRWDGGWAKEATVAEFPVSQALAGVLMSLVPGGLRELHWHANAAEWAYVIKGQCRVTTINPQGESQVVDFNAGDVWYFPRGFGHSIQGIGSEDCLFVLVFDNGYFSEFGTFSISDWVGTRRPRCWPNISACRPRHLRIFPSARSISRRDRCRRRCPQIRRRAQLTKARSLIATSCWRSAQASIQAAPIGWSRSSSFRSRLRSPARSCRSSPARCANRTGIPTPTNGSITSPAARA